MLIVLLLFGITVFYVSSGSKVSAATGINHQINFQGKLVNTDGTNVTDGTYSIVFSLYTVSSAGSNIWTETQSSVALSNGIFQVNLGSITTLPGSVDFNTDNLYLGIQVGADAEMTPRVQFTAVPQAFNSEKLGGLDKTGFIQNQTASPQTAGFNISGNGTLGGTLAVTSTSNLIGALTLGTASSATGQLKLANSTSAFTATIQSAAYVQNTVITLPATGATDTLCLQTLANCGGGSGVTTVGTYSTSNTAAGGATITGTSIIFQDASASAPGMIGTGAQTLAGVKTFSSQVVLNAGVQVASQKTIDFVGGTTAQRPVSPTAGMLYYDTDTDTLLQYNGSKWVSDHSASTKIVAASNSSQAVKDAADYIASGTDDGSTINTALTAASGGTVYLAEGTYSLTASNPISIPNNTMLAGAGPSTIITIPNAQNGTYSMITNTDTSTGTNVTISDLALDGNRANQTSGTMIGIFLDHMGTGNTFAATPGVKVSHVSATNMFNGTDLKLNNSSNSTITENTFQANTEAIILDLSSSNNVIASNTMRGIGASGVYMGNSSNDNTVSGNVLSNNGYSVYIESASHNTVTGNTIQDSVYGLSIVASASHNTVSGNTIAGTSNAIQLTTGANNNVISGNKIDDSGGTTANNGIYLDAADANSIIGNNISDSLCSSSCYAINIFNSTSDNNYLADNRFSDTDATHTASLNDSGTGTVYANQARGIDGGQLTVRTANNASAFAVQNATGIAALTIDTTVGTTTLRGTTTASDAAVIGSELFTGGAAFSAATGWNSISGTNQAATATHTAGTTAITTTVFTPTAGATYQVQFTLSGNTTATNTVTANLGGVPAPAIGQTGSNTHTVVITTSNTNALQFIPTTSFNGTITSVSIKLITKANSTLTVQSSTGAAALEVRVSSANFNTFLGLSSGQANTTGSNNSASGASALKSNITGSNNTAYGAYALQNNTTGSNNTALGYSTGSSLTTGSSNVLLGYNAATNLITGSNNIIIGQGATASSAVVSDYLNIGGLLQGDMSGLTLSLNGATTVSKSSTSALSVTNGTTAALTIDTTVGTTTLRGTTTASDAAVIGSELFTGGAVFNATTGWTSISGTNQSAAATHTAAGGTTSITTTGFTPISGATYRVSFSLTGNTTATDTVTASLGGDTSPSIGQTGSNTHTVVLTTTSTTALNFTPTTNFNGAITSVSVKLITISTSALTVQNSTGTAALEVRTSAATFNTFIGLRSGQADTTGSFNTASGYFALQSNTIGSSNTAVGALALTSNTTGTQNTAIGVEALKSNTTGTQNTAVGALALTSNTTGTQNTAFGYSALSANRTGSNNTAFGYFALSSNTTGINNTAFGNSALGSSTTTNYNTAFGSGALGANTSGTQNTASGYLALQNNASGSDNTASGNGVLLSNTTGSQNTAYGLSALQRNTIGNNNTASGWAALLNLKTLTGTISATVSNGGFTQFTTGSTTGLTAGTTITIASTTSYNGTKTIVSVDSSTTFTISTAFSSADATGTWMTASTDSNTAVGYQAGQGTSSGYTAVGNSLFGSNSGLNLQTGASNNTLIGYNAGSNITTGASNIIIGQGVSAASATGSNQLQLGAAISGDLSNGTLAVKAISDNAATFQVLNSSSVAVITANTLNLKLQVGSATASTNAVLLIANNYANGAIEPSGVNGAIYYNTGGKGGANGASGFEGKFRCYEGSTWKNCIGMRDIAERRWGLLVPQDIGNSTTTFTGSGGISAPTVPTGTIAANANTESYYVRATDAGTAGTIGGWNTFTTTNLKTQARYLPKLVTRIRVDASSVGAAGTNTTRYWAGLSSASMAGVEPTIASVANATASYMGVGFSNIANTNSMTWICGSGDGANHTGFDTGVAVTANNYYDIIVDLSTSGTLVCSVSTNGGAFTTVTKTTNLPGSATNLAIQETVTSVTAVSRAISIAYTYLDYQ